MFRGQSYSRSTLNITSEFFENLQFVVTFSLVILLADVFGNFGKCTKFVNVKFTDYFENDWY